MSFSIYYLLQNGNSVLSYAIRSCSPDMVTLMIKHGCPLNTVDNNGNSALCLACWIGALPVARVLISNGAAVNIANTVCKQFVKL